MPGEGRVQYDLLNITAEALNQRSWKVGWHIQKRWGIGQLLTPIIELPIQFVFLQPGALPDCKISVLHRELWVRRWFALPISAIERDQLLHDNIKHLCVSP